MNIELPDAELAYQALLIQIQSALPGAGSLLVGVHSGGAWIASRLCADLNETATVPVRLGFLSSAFHRDDYGQRGLPGEMKATDLPLSIDGTDIILVDDILYTGRTVRAVLNELFDYGRPRSVQLAVLVDRGGRELPIEANFVGAIFAPETGQKLQLQQDESGAFTLAIN
ncbi:MAG: bifunctional pyr operon transcriptional regulator/uracil phosphoribosyltransferase PyrR [Burkholderiaceae bacterium]